MAARKGIWGQPRGLDKRLARAYADFMEFCAASGKTTACQTFSKLKFDMPRGNSYPVSIGGKGFDTVVVCQWLEETMSKKVGVLKVVWHL